MKFVWVSYVCAKGQCNQFKFASNLRKIVRRTKKEG